MRKILLSSRTRILDDMVADFIRETEGPVTVVNLGCGLCTRYERLLADGKLDKNRAAWMNVDLPEMIELRDILWNSFSPDTEKQQLSFPCSVFSKDWTAKVDRSVPTLFIIEGVLGYYEKAEVVSFLNNMSRKSHTLQRWDESEPQKSV